MGVRLVTLVDNAVRPGKLGLLAEHGLSVLVEAHGQRILLDAGQTDVAVHNARALDLNLGTVDAIVLSHGHQDHTGGLRAVLREVSRQGREVPVYAHPDLWTARYSVREGERPRFAGLPYREEDLTALGARFHYSTAPLELWPGVWTTGEVPRHNDFERLDPALKVRLSEGWGQDQVRDDQALVVTSARGLIVVLGCAHAGIVNTLNHIREFTGERRLYAVVGGTHLGLGLKEQLAPSVAALREMGITRLGVSHCTGPEAAAELAQAFGAAFFANNAGNVVELG
jgi:7,8-dihydropterin-6-yl-methyl-4-(beta-D-ribofuranosyl)aminobenzene 5'-phosphate synthase